MAEMRPSPPLTDLTAEALVAAVGDTRVLRAYRVLESLPSTNAYLRDRAAELPDGTVVVARRQTAGRGRGGRVWVSPPGTGVYCSVLLHPPLPQRDLYLATVACAFAVRDAVGGVVEEPVVLKWPNDVLIAGRKVCGVLADLRTAPGGAPSLVVGFGVNVHEAPPPEVAPGATSVAAHAAGTVSRVALLGAVLRRYDALLAALWAGGSDGVWGMWRDALATLGREVAVRTADGGRFEGYALDVARDGALVVRPACGVPRTIYAAEAIEEPGVGRGAAL